jgi:hypothetical protein
MMMKLVSPLYKLTVAVLASTSITVIANAAQEVEVGSIKAKQSFRLNLNSQQNLEKEQVALPVQAALIYVLEQPLPRFLSQLAKRNNLEISISDEVKGRLKKLSLPMQLELALPQLAKAYGLQWHIHENHLFVSNSLENTNRIINLGQLDFAQLKQAINTAGLNPGANKIQYNQDQNAVTLIGSKTFIMRVQELVESNQN